MTTVDVSSVGVERARNTARDLKIPARILLSDLTTWKWPTAEYDAIASIYFHLLAEVRPTIHARMLQALKPGGILILEAFTPAQLQFLRAVPKHWICYTARRYCEAISHRRKFWNWKRRSYISTRVRCTAEKPLSCAPSFAKNKLHQLY